jgi:hypothetical protein
MRNISSKVNLRETLHRELDVQIDLLLMEATCAEANFVMTLHHDVVFCKGLTETVEIESQVIPVGGQDNFYCVNSREISYTKE